MAIIKIQKQLFMSRDQTDYLIRVIKRKMSFHAFSQCFLLFIDTALQKPDMLKLSITENRIEK